MSQPRTAVRGGPSVWPLPIFWLAPLLLSLTPAATTFVANAHWLPVPGHDIGRGAAVSVGAVLVLLGALQRFERHRGGMANWLGAVLVMFVSYGWVCNATGLDIEDGRAAALYTVATLGLATLAVRPRRDRRHDPFPLLIIAAVMLSSSGLRAVLRQPSAADRARWLQAVDELVAPPPSRASTEASAAASARGTAAAAAAPRRPDRDIYYIIVDGLGREDVLRDYYAVDLRPFAAFLRSLGFEVPEEAQSNYGQTFLSIASTLNLNYLDRLSTAMGPAEADRRPLARAIRRNALMALARRSGYQVVAIASDYEATQAFDGVDRCWCDRYGASGFEQGVVSSTPVAALPIARWTVDAHARKVREAFAALAAASHTGRRTFVFAHLVTPHPPFVFNEDGSRHAPSHVLGGFGDGAHFSGSRVEYVSGYRAQAQFVVRQLTELVATLLDRPGPPPAIVIHGDHGPGLSLDWRQPHLTDLRERMAIFSAYLLPDDGPAVYGTMTPVNGARALATRYFGVTLPYLPDRSHFSTWQRPYDDIAVTTP